MILDFSEILAMHRLHLKAIKVYGAVANLI